MKNECVVKKCYKSYLFGIRSNYSSERFKLMAQTVTPQCNEGYSGNQQQSDNNSTFVVVDQQPSERESFPYTLQTKWILGFSIFKYIFGALLFITGIVNIVLVKYDTEIGFPIWCGVIVRTALKIFPMHSFLL